MNHCKVNQIEPLTPGAAQIVKSASTGAAVGTALAGPVGLLVGLAMGAERGSREKVRISMFDNQADCEFVVVCDLDAGQRLGYFISRNMEPQDIDQINEDWLFWQKINLRRWIIILVSGYGIPILIGVLIGVLNSLID